MTECVNDEKETENAQLTNAKQLANNARQWLTALQKTHQIWEDIWHIATRKSSDHNNNKATVRKEAFWAPLPHNRAKKIKRCICKHIARDLRPFSVVDYNTFSEVSKHVGAKAYNYNKTAITDNAGNMDMDGIWERSTHHSVLHTL